MAEGAKRCIVHQLSKSKGLKGGFWLIFRVPEYSECDWQTCSALAFH